MKTLFFIFFSYVSVFATTYSDLGMSETDFNLASAITGLSSGLIISYAIIKNF